MLNTRVASLLSIQEGVLGRLSRYGNLLIVAGIGCVLAMLMLPLPSLVLDFLLALSIMGALTLLLVSISVSHSLKISAFPTILLLATLFRLGLNLSSTRLILSQGYAGHIIETFGGFATRGNLVVGLVMFLILTVIQYLVIAKGAERVAEVAARFTLDALPGKQMSIDADLRAGLIGQEEARTQREELQRESRMYGAMDGAMKFVKGDAIAGIVIIVINLLGGLFAGIVQRGLSLKEAIHTYSTLAIGDGLVSQIPALLVSISAGIIVTRVTHAREEKSLGKDIGFQILSQPHVLLITAGLSLLIGFIPGFPFALFFILAMALAGAALYLLHSLQKKALEPTPVEDYVLSPEQQMIERVGQASPLALEVGPELYQVFQGDPRWTYCFGGLYPKLKMHLTQQMGVVFPELKLQLNPNWRHPNRYQIRIFDVPVDHGVLNPAHCAVLGRRAWQAPEGVEAPEPGETAHGTPIQLVGLQYKPVLAEQGISAFGPEEMLLRHLAKILKRHAGDFVGIQEVHNLMGVVERNYPELVREVVPKLISIQKLTEVVKRLVEEEVPIKDFRLILQTLSCCQPEDKDPISLTEQVRIGLRRTLTFLHADPNAEGSTRISAFTIGQEIEAEIRKGIHKSGSECFLVLPPERLQGLARIFKACMGSARGEGKPPVLLTQSDIRRYIRKVIENELPNRAVLSFQELDPRAMIHHLGTVEEPMDGETVVVAR